MIEHWEQVPVFGDHIKRRAKESWKEGREEGREEGLDLVRKNISEVLHLRFGVTNGPIARAIKAVDQPQKLQTIFRRALTADSFEVVKKALTAEKLSSKKRVLAQNNSTRD